MSDDEKPPKWTLESFPLLMVFLESVPGEWALSQDRLEAVRSGGSKVVVLSQDYIAGQPLLGYYHGGVRISLQTADENEMIAQLRGEERRR